MFWPAVKHLAGLFAIKPELRCNHHLVPHRGQGFPHDILVEIRAIDLGGIKEGHTFIHRGTNQGDSLLFIRGRTIAVAQSHAAEAKR